ncbi:hypothetical protein T484DRAFT_1852717 [Baffinella frigidus]|nr:hypothetical protein T484DRAFT_1852717 [Cryptophyta sp. CCMP2293]
MSPSTSSVRPLRAECPTSCEQPLPRQSTRVCRDTVRRARSSAHESLWNLASTMGEDAGNVRPSYLRSCSDTALFKLPSVHLPFLRSADYDCGASQTCKLPSVSLPFPHSADLVHCDASPTPPDYRERLNDTTDLTPRVYRKSPYQRQHVLVLAPTEQEHSPSEDGVFGGLNLRTNFEDEDELFKWLDDTEDRAPRVYRATPYLATM